MPSIRSDQTDDEMEIQPKKKPKRKNAEGEKKNGIGEEKRKHWRDREKKNVEKLTSVLSSRFHANTKRVCDVRV